MSCSKVNARYWRKGVSSWSRFLTTRRSSSRTMDEAAADGRATKSPESPRSGIGLSRLGALPEWVLSMEMERGFHFVSTPDLRWERARSGGFETGASFPGARKRCPLHKSEALPSRLCPSHQRNTGACLSSSGAFVLAHNPAAAQPVTAQDSSKCARGLPLFASPAPLQVPSSSGVPAGRKAILQAQSSPRQPHAPHHPYSTRTSRSS